MFDGNLGGFDGILVSVSLGSRITWDEFSCSTDLVETADSNRVFMLVMV